MFRNSEGGNVLWVAVEVDGFKILAKCDGFGCRDICSRWGKHHVGRVTQTLRLGNAYLGNIGKQMHPTQRLWRISEKGPWDNSAEEPGPKTWMIVFYPGFS